MAYIGSQSNGIHTDHQEIISITGNISLENDPILLSVDTTNIVNIDLLELKFRPDAAEAVPADLDILDISWKNTNLKNNSGEHTISVFPLRNTDGVYHYEPNHPPNLLYQEHSLHTHLPKKYSLSVRKKGSGGRLQTQTIVIRLLVTKYRASSVIFHGKMEPAILNQ